MQPSHRHHLDQGAAGRPRSSACPAPQLQGPVADGPDPGRGPLAAAGVVVACPRAAGLATGLLRRSWRITRPPPPGLGGPAAEPRLDGGLGFGLGVAGLQGGGQQHHPNLVDVDQAGGDQLAEVERGPVQGGVAAPRQGGGDRGSLWPGPLARSRRRGRTRGWPGGGWSAPSPVGPGAAAARLGPRAAPPSAAGPRVEVPLACRDGGATISPSRPRQSIPGSSPTRLPRPVGAYSRCQPPPPVCATGPGCSGGAIDTAARSASTPRSPSRSRTSKRRPVTRPRLAWGQRRHHSPTVAGSVDASRFQPASRGCLPGSEHAGSGRYSPLRAGWRAWAPLGTQGRRTPQPLGRSPAPRGRPAARPGRAGPGRRGRSSATSLVVETKLAGRTEAGRPPAHQPPASRAARTGPAVWLTDSTTTATAVVASTRLGGRAPRAGPAGAMRQPWEVVADALQRAISDKTYEPGDRLPSESQLVARHDASRPTVR